MKHGFPVLALALAMAMCACETTPDCPGGQIADGDVCVPEACGVGTWGDLPVDGETVYVDIAADPGGDGSADAPLTSIQAGLDRAGDQGGGLVAVAAGTYNESLALDHHHAGVHLHGRCRELVTIDGSGREQDAVFLVDADAQDVVAVEGVTLTGGNASPHAAPSLEHAGLLVRGGELRVSQLDLAANGAHGIVVNGPTAQLDADRVDVHDNGGSSPGTYAVAVWFGGRTSLNDCRVTENPGRGLAVAFDSKVEVMGGEISANGPTGVWIAGVRSSVILDGVFITGNDGQGVHIEGGGVRVASSTIADNGYGISIMGGEVHVTASTIAGNQVMGLWAQNAGTTALLEDVEIRDNHPDRSGAYGAGVWASDRVTVAMERCLVSGNHRKGVIGVDWAYLDLHDVRIEDTRRDSGCSAAIGLSLQSESSAVASDLEIVGTEGPGVFLRTGSALQCAGCLIQDSTFAGVVTMWGSRLRLEAGSRIEGTRPDEEFGGGVGVLDENKNAMTHMLEIEDSTIGPHTLAAVWLQGPTGGLGRYILRRNELHGGEGQEILPGVWSHGDVIFARDQVHKSVPSLSNPDMTVQGLLLEDNEFIDASGAAVFLDGSSATLVGNTYQDNAIDLWQQRCDETEAVEGAEEASVREDCPDPARLNLSLHFDQWLQEPGME